MSALRMLIWRCRQPGFLRTVWRRAFHEKCSVCGHRFMPWDWDVIPFIGHAHYRCYNLKAGALKVRGREF